MKSNKWLQARITEGVFCSYISADRHGEINVASRHSRQRQPYMSQEQGDDCHACGWDNAEIHAFNARNARFICLGQTIDAEQFAERLTLRDREQDDRRLCLECTWLGDTGRCLAAATGRIPGADQRLEPVQNILHRCGAFGLRKRLI